MAPALRHNSRKTVGVEVKKTATHFNIEVRGQLPTACMFICSAVFKSLYAIKQQHCEPYYGVEDDGLELAILRIIGDLKTNGALNFGIKNVTKARKLL